MTDTNTQDEENQMCVDMAYDAVKTGSAGHWPTVGAFLVEEIDTLRARIAELTELEVRVRKRCHQAHPNWAPEIRELLSKPKEM